jgi:MFS family permease
MMVGPVVAGLVLTMFGFRAGFLFCALFYGVAVFWVSRVSPRPVGGCAALPAKRCVTHRWRIDRATMAFLGLSFLTWQANVLAMAYTFHLLHRQSFGYGITLAVWGGAGFVSGVALPRIRSHRQWLWVGLMFLVLGLCWAVLAHGVSFWPFVAISGFEGMATWVIQDLIEAHVLADAPAGRPGWPVPGWVSSTRWDRW